MKNWYLFEDLFGDLKTAKVFGFDRVCISGAEGRQALVTFYQASCYVRFAFLKLGLFFQKGM